MEHKKLSIRRRRITLHGVVCKSDITPMKHRSTSIISLRVVQQKHMRVQGMSIELQH